MYRLYSLCWLVVKPAVLYTAFVNTLLCNRLDN